MKYNDWEEAANESKFQRSYAVFGEVQDRRGKIVQADITMDKRHTALIVYKNTGRDIRRATAAEVDRATGWKPW